MSERIMQLPGGLARDAERVRRAIGADEEALAALGRIAYCAAQSVGVPRGSSGWGTLPNGSPRSPDNPYADFWDGPGKKPEPA